jgi:hypothetical protein
MIVFWSTTGGRRKLKSKKNQFGLRREEIKANSKNKHHRVLFLVL